MTSVKNIFVALSGNLSIFSFISAVVGFPPHILLTMIGLSLLIVLFYCFSSTVFYLHVCSLVGGGHLYAYPTYHFQDQGGVPFPPSVSQASPPLLSWLLFRVSWPVTELQNRMWSQLTPFSLSHSGPSETRFARSAFSFTLIARLWASPNPLMAIIVS